MLKSDMNQNWQPQINTRNIVIIGIVGVLICCICSLALAAVSFAMVQGFSTTTTSSSRSSTSLSTRSRSSSSSRSRTTSSAVSRNYKISSLSYNTAKRVWEYKVTGNMPTPCHYFRVEETILESNPEQVLLTIVEVDPEPDVMCSQVITPKTVVGDVAVSRNATVKLGNVRDSSRDE
jgi:hypothetical protein